MTTTNIILLVILLAGVAMFIVGLLKDKTSNFDDGSFILQILLMVAGGFLVGLVLIWKLIASFF